GRSGDKGCSARERMGGREEGEEVLASAVESLEGPIEDVGAFDLPSDRCRFAYQGGEAIELPIQLILLSLHRAAHPEGIGGHGDALRRESGDVLVDNGDALGLF